MSDGSFFFKIGESEPSLVHSFLSIWGWGPWGPLVGSLGGCPALGEHSCLCSFGGGMFLDIVHFGVDLGFECGGRRLSIVHFRGEECSGVASLSSATWGRCPMGFGRGARPSPTVGRSVRPSIGRSVRWSVRPSCVCVKYKKNL